MLEEKGFRTESEVRKITSVFRQEKRSIAVQHGTRKKDGRDAYLCSVYRLVVLVVKVSRKIRDSVPACALGKFHGRIIPVT